VTRREFTVANEYAYDLRSPGRWIVSHLLRYRLLPLGALLGQVCRTVLFSVVAIQIGKAFDLVAAPGTQPGQLLTLALLILAARFGTGLLDLGGVVAVETLAQRLERDARDELYVSLLGKSQTFHNRQKVGDIMARATNDMQQLSLMVNPGAALISESALFILIPLISIATIRLDLLLTPLLFLVAFYFGLRMYSRALNPVSIALRRQFGVMNARLAESISGIEVVKGYAQELQEQGIFAGNARSYRNLFIREGQARARYLPLLLFGIAFGLAFGHALLLYLGGQLTVGQVVAFMALIGVLRFPTFISLFSFALVQIGVAGAERILELIKAETELDENAGGHAAPMRGEIVFEHVSFGYRTGVRGQGSGIGNFAANVTSDSRSPIPDPYLVIENISFRAKPGETIAIVGQTGSGKSTLTKLVNRTYDASAGRVLVDGVDVREWSIESLRSQISTIEQDIFLFSRTIAENIAFGAAGRATREQIEQAAHEAQAHEFIMELPNGYDTVVGERGVTLSGGQRQRIAIARAFLTDPRILVLDDSTSAIDSATEDQIQRAMRRTPNGRATPLTTHRSSPLRWADRILVLRRGELAAQGTHEELLATSDAYRRIFARYERIEAGDKVTR
jgi:ATP-binding cassette subfamily B protein